MKNNKGITLLALVITIIILLILTGITISQLIGIGLFEKAKDSREIAIKAQLKEEIEMFIDELEIKYMLSGNKLDIKKISEELRDNFENIEIGNVDDKIIGEYKNYEFTITDNYEVIIEDKISGDKPTITHIVDTEVLGATQVTITIEASVRDGTIVEIVKPDGNVEKNTNNVTYTVNKSGKYVFTAKSSNGKKATYVVEIKNIKPSEPIIQAKGGYPVITSKGIQKLQEKVTIVYDDNDLLLNTYSEDNGVTFKEYKGPFQPNSSTIIAKSQYRENSEISIQSQKNIMTTDAIGLEAYDGNYDTYFATSVAVGNYGYIDIDPETVGWKVKFFVSVRNCSMPIIFIDDKGEIIDSINITENSIYTIPKGAVRLGVDTSNDGYYVQKLYEIEILNDI